MKKLIWAIFAANFATVFLGLVSAKLVLDRVRGPLPESPAQMQELLRKQGLQFGPDASKPRLPDPGKDMPFVFVSLLINVLLGSLLVLYIFVRYLRNHATQAEFVMNEFSRGNFKARFRIQKFDEISKIMLQFNSMASEVERLSKLRLESIQEMAHDLRTPLSTLKLQIESLQIDLDGHDNSKIEKELSAINSEVNYLSTLSEDLVLLARLEIPVNRSEFQTILFNQSVQRAVSSLEAQIKNSNIVPILKLLNNETEFRVDTKIWERVLKNALANSISFSKKSLQIKAYLDSSFIRLVIEDDGPGWPQSILESFGQKRFMRGEAYSSRPSFGLGSVIIKSGIEALGGHCELSQVIDGSQKVVGARLVLNIPAI